MQEEHLVHLKKNKILISVMLLHFGVFHNSSLLLTLASPAAPGQHSYLPWDRGAPTDQHTTRLWSTWPNPLHQAPAGNKKKQLKVCCKLLQSSLFPPLLFPPSQKLLLLCCWQDQRSGWCSPPPWTEAGIALLLSTYLILACQRL